MTNHYHILEYTEVEAKVFREKGYSGLKLIISVVSSAMVSQAH
jgi:hypothetical protein